MITLVLVYFGIKVLWHVVLGALSIIEQHNRWKEFRANLRKENL